MSKPLPPTHYFLGLDLGKDRDNSAIAALAYRIVYTRPVRPILELVKLYRIPIGTEYLEVMNRVRRIVTRTLASAPWGFGPPTVYLVVDSAGPGQVAVELIRREQLKIRIVPTLLSGGAESNYLRSGKITVPRRQLLSNTRYLFESDTLRVAANLKYRVALEAEFSAVRPAGRQSAHDDLAVATGLAAWHAVRVFPGLRNGRRAA
jgi:hypothetical protein